MSRRVDSLPLPALTMAERVPVNFSGDLADIADSVIASIADRATWPQRAALANLWLAANAPRDDGATLLDCVRILAAYLQTLHDHAITCADQAGMYFVCSSVEEQRGVAYDWLVNFGGVERWMNANPGFAAAMRALRQRSVRTGLGHLESSSS